MKNKGITLVALVITIIILLILAGITIAQLTGSGLFENARLAEEKYKDAQQKEQDTLDEYGKLINEENLPENTPDTEAGTEVTELTKVSTVYAIAVGNGESVPVPKGFYYVGGNLSTGVIISDNEADEYESGKDKTTWEYTTSLKGNQFVWIPCEESEYVKTNWGSSYQKANWDTTVDMAGKMQTQKYGGFYVGRYEAGLAETIEEFTETQKDTGSNQIYNLDGIPQSKAGQIPWMFIDWTHAKANAESMYDNDKYKNYVSSGLITGTQWDVMLNKMVEKTELEESDLTSSSEWGNYKDTQIEYTGRKSIVYFSGNWCLPVFGETETNKTAVYSSSKGDLLTTGASKKTGVYNIYDVAGNLWEWTEEASTYATSGQYRVVRGGSIVQIFDGSPACFRRGDFVIGDPNLDFGFRAVLYIK